MHRQRCAPRNQRDVVEFVGRLCQELAAGFEDPENFTQRGFRILEVLEHIVAEHHVKAAFGIGDPAGWRVNQLCFIQIGMAQDGWVYIHASKQAKTAGEPQLLELAAPGSVVEDRAGAIGRGQDPVAQDLVIPVRPDAGIKTLVQSFDEG